MESGRYVVSASFINNNKLVGIESLRISNDHNLDEHFESFKTIYRKDKYKSKYESIVIAIVNSLSKRIIKMEKIK